MEKGYYQTPNVNVPLNDRPKGEIAEVAKRQLRPYQVAASTWPIDHSGISRLCGVCKQNLWFYADIYGKPYFYQPGEITALIVAHIRQVHTDAITAEDTSNEG